VLVAYEFYRGPQGERGTAAGLLPRCEFGLEILITLAHQSLVIGVSLDKALEQLRFFWELQLSKSQADALLSRLSREWHVELDRLCQLIAVSAVVHTDETSWSIGSVWTFLSEQSRLLISGCREDAATLEILLPKATFAGVLVSDDAAVYRGFTQAQKCWEHLLRKAIKLTIIKPDDTRYSTFGSSGRCVLRPKCKVTKDFGGMTPRSNADVGANMADVGAVVWRNGVWLCGDATKQRISTPPMRQWRVRP